MLIQPLEIPEVLLIKPDVHGDHRGYFMETWRNEWCGEIGREIEFVQDNQSKSAKGTLRGLHYQIQQPQGKYLRVLAGEVFDVAVDMRSTSATFGKWVGVMLSASNKNGIWVPPGFAHGFYVTSESAEIAYKCTDYYAAEHERCLKWNDPELGIEWPLVEELVLLSDKDKGGLLFSECESYS